MLLVQAAEITDIKFSDLSLTPSGPRNPALAWLATFNFNIDDTSAISKGDTFSIDLANVYRIKFDDENATMDIKLTDGTIAFLCYVSQQGSYKYSSSILTCIAQKDLSSYTSISGKMSFSLSFNDGGSTKYEPELIGAKIFKAGTQDISLNSQLSTSVSFDATTNSDNFYSLGRTTTYNSMESYYLDMNCSSGYIISGKETINYDYQNGGYTLDCSSLQVATSNSFNDFLFPLNASTTNINYFCLDNTVTINVGESAFDSLLFVNGLQLAPNDINSIVHRLDAAYTCMDTIASTTYATSFSVINTFVIVQGQNYAIATADSSSEMSTTSYLPSRISQITFTSTTTTGWTGSFTSTYSTETTVTTDSLGSTTPEVIIHIETPSTSSVPATTVTSTTTTGWTGSFTSTYSTETTVTTDSLGSTTPEVIIHIETPSTSSIPAITITSISTNVRKSEATHISTLKTYISQGPSVSSSLLFNFTYNTTGISSTSDIASTSSGLISVDFATSSTEVPRVITQTQNSTTFVGVSTSEGTSIVTLSSISKSGCSTSRNTNVPIKTPFTNLTLISSYLVVFPSTKTSSSQESSSKSTLNASSISKVQSSSTTLGDEGTTTVLTIVQINSDTTVKQSINTPSETIVSMSHLDKQITSSTADHIISIFDGAGDSLKVTGFVSSILTLISLFLLG